MTTTVHNIAELTDLSGEDPTWRVPAGTELTVISDEGDWLMVEHPVYGVFGVDKDNTREFAEV